MFIKSDYPTTPWPGVRTMTKSKNPNSHYRLNTSEVIQTAERLHARILERFPGSGLVAVAQGLAALARDSAARAEMMARPYLGIRIAVGVLILGFVTLMVGVLLVMDFGIRFADNLSEGLQASEAILNETVFLFAGMFFLFTLEARLKRKRALRALHELRSFAHIIDMHQLTKDPERLLDPARDTPSSPERNLTTFELSRYLDYCSEMLAIVSKIGAIYAEHFQDATALSAIDEVERLTDGLSRKIWQKIMIVSANVEHAPTSRVRRGQKKSPAPLNRDNPDDR